MRPTATFSSKLLGWYHASARDLPWRRTSDPYKIWISEIMLQQTTVNAVIPYYLRWIKQYPTIKYVAKAPLQKILKSWQGLGYYSRARNLHKAAKLICDVHGGRIPNDPDLLRKLPGFGPYTTGAVLSIAFGQRQPIIDANVRRVIMRQLALKGFADLSHDDKILNFLDRVMPFKEMSSFNQALMELGALVCRNKEVLCNLCPVRKSCLAYKQGTQEIIPQPKKKILKDLDVVVGLIRSNGKYFIQKRSSKGLLADLWEFPGGKIEPGETQRQALVREIKEEIGGNVTSARHLFNLRHFYTQFRVNLFVWSCVLKSTPRTDTTHLFVSPSELSRFPMPSGSVKILDRLLRT